MKRIATILLFALMVVTVYAKDVPQVKINHAVLAERDGQVTLSFDVQVPKLGSNYKLILTPVVYAATERQSLPPLVVMGRKKQTSDRRAHTSSQKVGNDNATATAKRNRSGSVLHYQYRFAYQPWMSQLSLQLERSIEGCCREQALASLPVFANRLIHYAPQPTFADTLLQPRLSPLQQFDAQSPFLYSASNYSRRQAIFDEQREKGALMVNFKQGASSIDPNYMNNRNTLEQINRALDLIDADPAATLKKIVIVGMTSPEGTLAQNDRLATLRGEELKYFVGERVKYDPHLFEIINGSEDWEGLKRLVEASRMPHRWLVLETMDKYTVRGGREVELMKLKGGVPYLYMLEHFFPQLRNAGFVQVYYDYTPQPDPDAERTERGVALMKSEQYSEALTELLQVGSPTPRVANAIGTCYLMTGDYMQAETYLNRAAEQGDEQAVENLKQLNLLKQVQQ